MSRATWEHTRVLARAAPAPHSRSVTRQVTSWSSTLGILHISSPTCAQNGPKANRRSRLEPLGHGSSAGLSAHPRLQDLSTPHGCQPARSLPGSNTLTRVAPTKEIKQPSASRHAAGRQPPGASAGSAALTATHACPREEGPALADLHNGVVSKTPLSLNPHMPTLLKH